MFVRQVIPSLMLAGLAQAVVTSVKYITQYETNCLACTAPSSVLVAVAASPVVNTVATTQKAVPVVATGTVVVAPKPSSSSSTTPVRATPSTSTLPAPAAQTPGVVVAAVGTSVTAPVSVAACPATAHVDALGSKNYPRVITPVSSVKQNLVYGPQYFGSIGGGNSTIFTFDYQKAGTCTLEFKFPSMAQIVALQGTTSYKISSGSISATLYTLASVAAADASFANKPARVASYPVTLTPGSNSTITSFACPVGTSQSYELVASDSNTLSWFEGTSTSHSVPNIILTRADYNPPPLGLLALMC